MEAIRSTDDYALWLQGVFDSIGDRQPSEAEWKMIKERHALMAGEVVLQRMEKRQYELDLQRKLDTLKHPIYGASYHPNTTTTATTLAAQQAYVDAKAKFDATMYAAKHYGTLSTSEEE